MTPIKPPTDYSQANEAQFRQAVLTADAQNLKFGEDISASRLILRSPNGSGWVITVSNAGAVSAIAL